MNGPAPMALVDDNEILFCFGLGQYHSINHPTNPQSYRRISGSEIECMAKNPPCVEKSEAQWAIFSTLPSRVHKLQLEHGQFWWSWLDIDKNPNSFEYVFESIKRLFPGTKSIAYLTSGATVENQKCRVIIPFSNLCPGEVFILIQKFLNDRVEKARITPDRKTEAAGQICYLPNRGAFYQYHVEPGNLLEWETTFQDDLSAEKERIKTAEIELAARREQSRIKAVERMASGTISPIDAYNVAYSIEDCLLTYGYKQQGNRYLSPNSSSGSPGVSVKDNKWISSHESDRETVGVFGDAFDLFTYYEHRGDRNAALKAAGEMFTVNRVSLNLANRKTFKEGQPQLNPATHRTAENLSEKPEPTQEEEFDLRNFSLNGKSKAMELQMLDDKFVLGLMALLGQSTIFYAKPNAGKTLLTIWLICEKIKSGELKGSDVFYINADDTHKGLVYKLKLAEEQGFHMLAPGYAGFKAEHLSEYLKKMIASDTARGKTLILDTSKKFTDPMSKDKSSQFGETVRQFVSFGGTVVALAHVNKHRNEEKKVIYAGTSNLVDDADCAYTLDIVNDDPATGLRTVVFENFKSRGDSIREAFYRYNYADGTPYHERLKSVVAVGEEERKEAEKAQRLATILERNQPAIETIKECIRENINQKTALVKEASDRSGISKKKITQVLLDHTGNSPSENEFWRVNVEEKNAHAFELNYGVL
jgi:hypothetical protein